MYGLINEGECFIVANPSGEPKSAVEEREILESAVPWSTRLVHKWAMNVFGEWQVGRTIRKPVRI